MPLEITRFNSLKNKVFSFTQAHFSWKFLRSILSVREIILPFTIQKPFLWLLYAGIIGGLIATQATVGFVEYLYVAVNANIIALAVFLIAVEPVYFLFMMLFTKYPKIDISYANIQDDSATVLTDLEAPEHREILDQDTSIIIACHRSQDNIENTLKHWLNVVPARRIYVIDNGDPPYPKDTNNQLIDNTKSLVTQINPEVNYIFSNRGNKTYSLYLGALKATTTNVIICDDDIIPPSNVLDALPLLNEEYKAVVFPIKAMQRTEHGRLLTAWQNLEYCLADHAKNYEDRSCGPTRPHGACSLWNKQFMLDILFKHHDTRFMGEDLKMGLRALQEGTKFRYAHGLYVKTFVPSSLIGPMPNYYTQRVRVWEMGRHIYWPMVTRYLITTWQKSDNPLKSFRNNIVLKIEQLYFLYQVLADWLRLPVLLLSAHNWRYWAVSAGCYGLLITTLLLWNYVKLRNHPEEKHSLLTLLSYPIYKIIYKIFSVLAMFRAIFIFLPNYSSLIRIDQLEAARLDTEEHQRFFLASQSALPRIRPFNWAEYTTRFLVTEAERAVGYQQPQECMASAYVPNTPLSTIYSLPPLPPLPPLYPLGNPLFQMPPPSNQQPVRYNPTLGLPQLCGIPCTMPRPITQQPQYTTEDPRDLIARPLNWAPYVTKLIQTEAQKLTVHPQLTLQPMLSLIPAVTLSPTTMRRAHFMYDTLYGQDTIREEQYPFYFQP
jgi:glycosyltransferase involved in cell wall biosynthesis